MVNIWALRERITEACGQEGKVYKYDISLPTDKMYQIVEIFRNKFSQDEVKVVGYGHLGDGINLHSIVLYLTNNLGNLHLNLVAPKYDPKYLNQIEPFVYEHTASLRGSISAEHGIGVMKPGALHYSKSSSFIQTMKSVKHLFDPNGILNPYKVIPDS